MASPAARARPIRDAGRITGQLDYHLHYTQTAGVTVDTRHQRDGFLPRRITVEGIDGCRHRLLFEREQQADFVPFPTDAYVAGVDYDLEPEQPPPHVAIGCAPKGIKARRLRCVLGIDIERCAGCGGTLRIIACIEDRAVIEKILAHRRHIHALQGTSDSAPSGSGVSEARGPPYGTQRA